MPQKAILAIEEALLSSLFTQRALVGLLIRKGIITKEDFEQELMNTETTSIGAGKTHKHLFLEKRNIKHSRREGTKPNNKKGSGQHRRRATGKS